MQESSGRLIVLGSTHMFSDQYLDKEENSKVQDVMFRLLTTDEISLNPIDADDPEVRVMIVNLRNGSMHSSMTLLFSNLE